MQETTADPGIFGQEVATAKPKGRQSPNPSVAKTADETMSYEDQKAFAWWENQYVARASDDETQFRHIGWLRTRRLVSEALTRCNESANRQLRFNCCGSRAFIFWSPSLKKHAIKASYCHDRFCRPCGDARALRIAKVLAEHIKPTELRFLTLTIAHYTAPLREQIDRLRESFRRLKQTKLWKHCVKGGCLFFELKRSKNRLFWHPHLHFIIEGTYIDHAALKRAWLSATGDSYIIDISRCRDREHLIAYCSKYSTKPLDPSVFECEEWLDESIMALKGVRMCQPFGTWYHFKLNEIPPDPGDWQSCGSLDNVLAAARKHEPWAEAIMHALRCPEDVLAPVLFDQETSIGDFW